MGGLSEAPGAGAAGVTRDAVLLRVSGRVQGVGYRAFVRERARELGVVGWTCNLPDGSVAVAAGGPPIAVDGLRAALADGPPGATVTRVDAVGRVGLEDRDFAIVRSLPPAAAGALRAGQG